MCIRDSPNYVGLKMKITINQRAEKELLALRTVLGDHALQHIVNILISEAYQNKVVPLHEENLHYGNSTIRTN